MSSDSSLCPDCGSICSSREECQTCKSEADKIKLEELRRVLTPTQNFGKPDILKTTEETANELEATLPDLTQRVSELVIPSPSPQETEKTDHQNATHENPKQKKGFLGLIMSWFGLN